MVMAVTSVSEPAGEARVNLVRLAALIAFYGYHLVYAVASGDPSVGGTFHLAVTALAMVWAVGVAALYFLLRRGRPSDVLAYLVTAWDLLLVTALVLLAGGPRSPLVVLYFLVVAAAPPRGRAPLVYWATLGSVAAYLFLLGHYAFVVVGPQRYYASPELRVPRTQDAVTLLALLTAGLLGRQAAGGQARAPGGEWSAVVAGGLIVMAVLVGLGLLLSALGVVAPSEGRPWPGLALLVALFLAAVAAAVVESFKAGGARR
jgi:hypothetical protein